MSSLRILSLKNNRVCERMEQSGYESSMMLSDRMEVV